MGAAVEVHDLYRFFHTGDDEVLALRGVSLVVEEGCIAAVTGPSGSGKSTLLACMAGLDEPDGGTVRVAGQILTRRDETTRAALRARWIGVLFQTDNLVEHLSVSDNVLLARRLAGQRTVGDRDLLERLGLAHRAHARPSELSGGEAARAGMAVALANGPAVVLADEPTGELDSTTEHGVLDLLREVAEGGTAVVVVTHSPVVAEFADLTIGLEDGRRVA